MSKRNIQSSDLPSSVAFGSSLGASGSGVSGLLGNRKMLLGVAPGGANPSLAQVQAFNAQIAPRRVDMVLLSSTFPTSPVLFGTPNTAYTSGNQIAMCQQLDAIPQVIWDPSGTTLGSVTSGGTEST
jgi:hypothetical protein